MTLFDRNRDGQVTSEEFDGPPQRFAALDENGDGVVSRDEAAQAGPPGRGRQPAGDRGAPGEGPPRGPRDGRSSEGEVPPGINEKVRADATWNELPPSFVFILADDMGWTGTSVQMDDQVPESKSDYYRTPNLEKLAQHGLRFTQAYAPSSLCTPTRAAILTGRTPAALHVTTPGGGRTQVTRKLLTPPQPRIKIEDGETTIAEALKEVGYTTAHLGKWHLGRRGHPGEHGFDFHDGNTENDGPGHFEDPNPKDIFGITQRAVAFMRGQVQQNKPFYLHLSHYAVHLPTLARDSTVTTFDSLPRGTRHQDAAYAAMTFDLDSSIGILLAEIKALGIANNTYVVFMSDNGAPGGPRRRAENFPLAGGKSQLYEGGIRVPFIARGPGIPAGAICREAITGCDLFPTFCELAGASIPENVDGTSVVPLLSDRPDSFARKEPSLLFHYPHYGQGAAVPQSALVVGKYKIIRYCESGSTELFDLTKDLSESNDLARVLPKKAKELEELLDNRLKRANAQMTSVNPDYEPDTVWSKN